MAVRAFGVALLFVLTVHLVAAQSQPLRGAIRVDDVLTVEAGETLVLAAGTSLSGTGRVEVRGSLDVQGVPLDRVAIAVPILVEGNGSARFVGARLWGVDGVHLTVKGGAVDLADVLIEGNGVGIQVGPGPANVTARNVHLRDHAEAALTAVGSARVEVRNATLSSNVRSVVADLDANGSMLVEGSTLGPSPGASVAARGGGVVLLVANRYVGGDEALRVESGATVESRNDSFEGNRVGVSAMGGTLRLIGATFQTIERDILSAPGARLELVDVAFTPAVAQAPSAPGGSPLPFAWIALALVALAGGAFAWRRRRPLVVSDGPPVEPPLLEPPPSPTETRILADVAAHPRTPQSAAAARLGMTRQALHYHVKKLEARRLIVKSAEGRETRCSVPPGVVQALGLPQPSPPRSPEKG